MYTEPTILPEILQQSIFRSPKLHPSLETSPKDVPRPIHPSLLRRITLSIRNTHHRCKSRQLKFHLPRRPLTRSRHSQRGRFQSISLYESPSNQIRTELRCDALRQSHPNRSGTSLDEIPI